MITQKIRVLLADPETIVRTAFRMLLEKAGIEVVGEAEDGQKAIMLAEKLRPDVVILEVKLPILNGLEVARRIKRMSLSKILICSAHGSDNCVQQSLAIPVDGYMLKHNSAADLISAVHEIKKGANLFSPTVTSHMLRILSARKGVLDSKKRKGSGRLSLREKEIVQRVAEGYANKQIADQLRISIKTVEKHRQTLMKKIDIHGVADLTRYAIERGMITSEMRVRLTA